MKTILGKILVVCLVLTLVFSLLPVSAFSSQMTSDDMRLITGGNVAIDCSAAATTIQIFCYVAGGSTTTCTIAYGIAYLTCLIGKIL
ncbi:MAG TPA: hypothetical protein VMG34_15900 [Bacteroidota bacterium]|nr:hypothetical protein [Bacteroidota bacterium]